MSGINKSITSGTCRTSRDQLCRALGEVSAIGYAWVQNPYFSSAAWVMASLPSLNGFLPKTGIVLPL